MDARTKIVIGSQFAAWGDPEIAETALAQLVERGLRQPELLRTDNFRRRFTRLVQITLTQEGMSRAELLDTVEDQLECAPPGVAETMRAILASSLMPPAATGDQGLVPLLSRLSGAKSAQDAARTLIAHLQERYGAGVSVQIMLAAPKPEVIASVEPPAAPTGLFAAAPPHAPAGSESFTIHWTEGDAELGAMTVRGLTSGQKESLSELAPWLQPTFKRLVDAQLHKDSELLYARQRRMWQIKAEMLDLAQKPQSSEAYLRQVVSRVHELFGARQVVYWAYHAEDDSLEVCQQSRPESGDEAAVPVSAGLFQEAVVNRQVKTAAVEDAHGQLRLFLLGPLFHETELIGVFQVVLPTMLIGSEAEEDLALVTEIVASGLKTVRFYEQLSYHASHDPLTGLANRRTFEQFFTREYKLAERHGTPISLMLVDLDRFKLYNDTFGHPAGDALLREVAGAIATAVRSTDFVARYGGEEFVVVLPHTSREGAHAAAVKVRDAIRSLHERVTVHSGQATASIGVASFPEDGQGMMALLEAADQAMYRAKQTGRDRICAAEGPAEKPSEGPAQG